MNTTKAKVAVAAGVVLILAAVTTTVIVKGSGHNRGVKFEPDAVTGESFKRESNVRVDQAKRWALGCLLFAGDHGNQLPNNFEQLKTYVTGVSDSNWEIESCANESSLTNSSENPRIILLREKQSRSLGGNFVKAYAFVDGHVELINSPDGDFATVEKQRGFLTRVEKN
jgi:hypothetical protein